MGSALPVRLRQDTIIEALCELRFRPTAPGVSDLLPGYFRQSLPHLVNHVERLAVADLPTQVVTQTEQLKYKPSHRLSGETYQVASGQNVANISCNAPYVGWSEFQPKILEMLRSLISFDVIDEVERLSLRYINIIPELNQISALDAIECSMQLGSFDLREHGFQLRTEIESHGCKNIVNVSPNSTAQNLRTKKVVHGTWLDIDSITTIGGDVETLEFESLIEKVHDAEKSVFFNILSKAAQEQLGAEYE